VKDKGLDMLRPKLTSMALAVCLAQLAQASGAERKIPGVKEVQVPFQSLQPSATFKIGKTADWVLVTDDAVWVGGSRPYSVQRIDPSTNKVVAKVMLSGEACSGLAIGFGSVWFPVCGKSPTLTRVDVRTNQISAILPFGTIGAEASLGLHLHQVGQRTFTSKLLSMPSTQRSRSRGGR
jgi:streptogramin lyase